MDVLIRNVDPVAMKKIDELANKKGISRNEYLRMQIEQIAIMRDLNEIEDKYANLDKSIVDRLDQANDVIKENSIILNKIRSES